MIWGESPKDIQENTKTSENQGERKTRLFWQDEIGMCVAGRHQYYAPTDSLEMGLAVSFLPAQTLPTFPLSV